MSWLNKQSRPSSSFMIQTATSRYKSTKQSRLSTLDSDTSTNLRRLHCWTPSSSCRSLIRTTTRWYQDRRCSNSFTVFSAAPRDHHSLIIHHILLFLQLEIHFRRSLNFIELKFISFCWLCENTLDFWLRKHVLEKSKRQYGSFELALIRETVSRPSSSQKINKICLSNWFMVILQLECIE